jgi:hypothetical protein
VRELGIAPSAVVTLHDVHGWPMHECAIALRRGDDEAGAAARRPRGRPGGARGGGRQPVSELRPRMSCREVIDLLSDDLDDALHPTTRERVEAHLATRPDCSAYGEQLRTTIGLLGRLREEDVPEPVRGELVRSFRGWRSG